MSTLSGGVPGRAKPPPKNGNSKLKQNGIHTKRPSPPRPPPPPPVARVAEFDYVGTWLLLTCSTNCLFITISKPIEDVEGEETGSSTDDSSWSPDRSSYPPPLVSSTWFCLDWLPINYSFTSDLSRCALSRFTCLLSLLIFVYFVLCIPYSICTPPLYWFHYYWFISLKSLDCVGTTKTTNFRRR